MAKQLQCTIHPSEPQKYYALRDDGMMTLYVSGSREPLREFAAD